ncbi:MAG: hypothetical protein RRA92_05355 [Gemmatimonadota bacterium]|nr:hypothetical protein [Gemmatimonadota bacterium]
MHEERDVRREPATPRTPAEAWPLLKGAVEPILERNDAARAAFDAMCERGRSAEEAREEIARVLLAVMFHVGAESERLRTAGGGEGLRAEAFRRLADGETAKQIFEPGDD